jgi:nitrite reductase/ring-hydroxylating ferredoxin subunit
MEHVCNLTDIPDDSAREFQKDGQPVVLVKHDGLVRAFVNWCPHLGIELNFMPDQFMDSDNQFIMCANHGALFEIDSGDCLSGPCSGDKLIPVPLEVRGDEVWLGSVEVPA